ncbi:MAG: hypothetical protein V1863_01855 [Candidatus Omnitrophota bacterium]
MSKTILITWGVLSGLLVVLLVGLGLKGNAFEKNFRNEMALRLDVEEKLVQAENERQGLQTDLKNVRAQLKKANDELLELRKKLAKEQEENVILNEMLERKQTKTISP